MNKEFIVEYIGVLLIVLALIFCLNYIIQKPVPKQPVTIEWVNDKPLFIIIQVNNNDHNIVVTNGISLGMRSDGAVVWKLTHNW